jgi:hypothetical protein
MPASIGLDPQTHNGKGCPAARGPHGQVHVHGVDDPDFGTREPRTPASTSYKLPATGYKLTHPVNSSPFPPVFKRSAAPANGNCFPDSYARNCGISSLESTPKQISFFFQRVDNRRVWPEKCLPFS